MRPAEPAPSHQPNPTFRLVLLVVLLLVTLAAGGALGWLLIGDRGTGDDPQSESEAAMARTEQFVLRLNTLGPDQLDGGRLTEYRQQVAEVVTPAFAADFEANGLPLAERLVTQAGYGRTAEILGVGVESIDEDTATVLVAASLTGSYPDPKAPKDGAKRAQSDEDVLRWEVDLVRTDGTWLVDDYSPVTGEATP